MKSDCWCIILHTSSSVNITRVYSLLCGYCVCGKLWSPQRHINTYFLLSCVGLHEPGQGSALDLRSLGTSRQKSEHCLSTWRICRIKNRLPLCVESTELVVVGLDLRYFEQCAGYITRTSVPCVPHERIAYETESRSHKENCIVNYASRTTNCWNTLREKAQGWSGTPNTHGRFSHSSCVNILTHFSEDRGLTLPTDQSTRSLFYKHNQSSLRRPTEQGVLQTRGDYATPIHQLWRWTNTDILFVTQWMACIPVSWIKASNWCTFCVRGNYRNVFSDGGKTMMNEERLMDNDDSKARWRKHDSQRGITQTHFRILCNACGWILLSCSCCLAF